jgi:tRNA nucleotidyltransferase/poly(A) polymerase
MRNMLASPHRAVALRLLHQSRLLAVVFPELEQLAAQQSDSVWPRLLTHAARLRTDSFATALGLMLFELADQDRSQPAEQLAARVAQRWRLARREAKLSHWLAENVTVLTQAVSMPWPQVQRRLVHHDALELLAIATALVDRPDNDPNIQFCRQKLDLPRQELNPPLLLTGADLIRWGIERGPCYAVVLDRVRDAQLEGQIHSVEEARTLALQLLQTG